MTGLKNFGVYLNKLFTIDAFFLNEDRHTHNIAVLMNEKGEFAYCPIFDNGAGLLSDTLMDYPLHPVSILGIPYRTVQDWELGNRQMPEYLFRLMEYKIQIEIRKKPSF